MLIHMFIFTAYVAIWCHLENVVVVSIFLSLKSEAALFQLALLQNQRRSSLSFMEPAVTMQMQKPFAGFEMLIILVLYRTLGT